MRHPEPSSCRKLQRAFCLRNRIIEPENSMHAGTNATIALNSVAFMARPKYGQYNPGYALRRAETKTLLFNTTLENTPGAWRWPGPRQPADSPDTGWHSIWLRWPSCRRLAAATEDQS